MALRVPMVSKYVIYVEKSKSSESFLTRDFEDCSELLEAGNQHFISCFFKILKQLAYEPAIINKSVVLQSALCWSHRALLSIHRDHSVEHRK